MDKEESKLLKKNEDLKGRKANRNNIIAVTAIFLVLIIVSGIFFVYMYTGKTDYDKGFGFYKEKKYTEALFEFQKIDPDDKNFNNAQSGINYINGLQAFNEGRKLDAIVFLSKVRPDDEYYADARLMLEKINPADIGNDLQAQGDSLKNVKDTVIIKKEVTRGKETGEKDPVDPKLAEDREISGKYVTDAGNIISNFESIYQSARTAPLNTKSDFGKSMESVNKNFNNIKYSAQNKDAGVIELKRLVSEWMSKRIAFIRQLITDKTVSETNTSRSLKEEGDKLYASMMDQLNKVKKNI